MQIPANMNDSRYSILYLEDDPSSIELVEFTLGLANMDVVSTASCEEAEWLACSRKFDLYLLDGLLPSGYSFDLCRKLRQTDPRVPIAFYTALGFPSEVEKGGDAGADAYLLKPFLGDLAETLATLIRDFEERHAVRNQLSAAGVRAALY